MPTAYIGLGSNLGDRAHLMEEALRRLVARQDMRVLKVSPAYETEPVGVLDQPRFLNAAASLSVALGARDLLDVLLGVESDMGRIRERKWGPRPIDLDLLFYGDAVLREEGLSVPHPLLSERLFVLAPLCDLNDALIHPVLRRTLRALYEDACSSKPLKPVGRLNWKEQ